MSTFSSHEALQETLAAAALESLDSAKLERVLKHVRHCAECAAILEDYRTVTAALGLLLPERRMDADRSAALRATLLARARWSAQRSIALHAPSVVRPQSGAPRVGQWAGWTVAAALAGVLLMHHAVHRPLNYGWLVAGAVIVLLVALGVYASMQRARVSMLTERLASLRTEPEPEAHMSPVVGRPRSGDHPPLPQRDADDAGFH